MYKNILNYGGCQKWVWKAFDICVAFITNNIAVKLQGKIVERAILVLCGSKNLSNCTFK